MFGSGDPDTLIQDLLEEHPSLIDFDGDENDHDAIQDAFLDNILENCAVMKQITDFVLSLLREDFDERTCEGGDCCFQRDVFYYVFPDGTAFCDIAFDNGFHEEKLYDEAQYYASEMASAVFGAVFHAH